ncbi:MAG: hypothetical protein IPP71_05680 [Bacteroidetes bacterium]|nr:hypothetical protein [Bacteroidota bacterium]
MNGGFVLKPVVLLVSLGTSNTTGTGNSIFEDSLTITHSGVFYFTMGSSTNDFFNGPVSVTNHASKEVYMANGDTSFYNPNVTISSTGNDVWHFGNGGGCRFWQVAKLSALVPGLWSRII